MSVSHCNGGNCDAAIGAGCDCNCERCGLSLGELIRRGHEHGALATRIATMEADLERARAEVAYLRAHREWVSLVSVANLSDDCRRRVATGAEIGMCPACKAWIAANPMPAPPEGVEP